MSKSQFSVRPFRPADKEGWATLWAEYTKNYEPQLTDPRVPESNWQAIMKNEGRLYALALTDEAGRIAGFAHYIFHHTTKSVHLECYLIDLFVAENSRGKRGGQLLLEKLYEICREKDLYRVTWISKTDNLNAHKLYDRMAKGKEWIRYIHKMG